MPTLRILGLVIVGALVLGVVAGPGPAKRGTFPGRNGRLAFALGGELSTVNPDGSDKRLVIGRARGFAPASPAWAPDGNRIAFQNSIGSTGGIWYVNTDGTSPKRVTTDQNDREPAWSPDGRRLVFVRNADGRDRLFVVNADGSGLTNVTPGLTVSAEEPNWSPDGARIAFTDLGRIYIVNADGSGFRQLTGPESGNAAYPSWSPDGSRIAFASGPASIGAIRVVQPDGGGLGVLVPNLAEVWEVAWSPDGTKLAFSQDVGGPLQEELFTANADGSGLARLNVDASTNVDWGVLGAVPVPVAGVSVNVAPAGGVVLVRLRGSNRFVNLKSLRNVPVGSEFDVRRGRVRLVSAAGGRKTQTGTFYQGRAVVRQVRARLPVTTLEVSGPLVCPKRKPSAAGATKPPRVRRLWGNAKGRFRTRGKYASAAVRGTVWLTEDRCDGTLVRVRSGRVEVTDLVAKRRVVVRSGQSYLARARR
jgi:dipeptidyl aminopeptidase/acylaminoacyl peptidase